MHIQGQESEMEISSYGIDRKQKKISCSPAKLDNRLSKMYKISGQVIKFIENTMQNCRFELTTGEKFWGENPERNLPERCAFTITVCDSDDATQSNT